MSQFEVKVRCTVLKYVTCEDCTEEEARADPFAYAVDEEERSMEDWQVLEVKEDKGG